MTGTKKSTGKMFSLGITIAVLFLMTAAIIPGVWGATAVDLGSAGNFAVLAKSAITDIAPPLSVITGDVGLSPETGAAIVGFDSCTQVSASGGTIYMVNAAGPGCATNDPTLVGNAVADMVAAYADASSGTAVPQSVGEIGGTTLHPGNYSWTEAVTIGSGDVTLDGQGDANAVWIFRTTGALTSGDNRNVILVNGAQPNNIFWVVAGYTALGTGSGFNGTILGAGYITLNNGATLNGRTLAQTAVTLENNPVTVPVLRVAPVVAFTFTNNTGTAPLTVAFTDTSSHDLTATITSWAWDFENDGVIDSTSQNPLFIYDTAGIYTPNLTVTDSFGAVAYSSQLDTVTVYQPPVADFTFTPASGPAYLTVAFTDTSYADPTPPLSISSWAWDFENDGIIDNTTQNPVYRYYSVGGKTVNLTVTDSFGAVATKLDTVTVDQPILSINVNGPLILALNSDQTTTNTDLEFNVTSTINWQVTAYDAGVTTVGYMTSYSVSGAEYTVPVTHLTERFMIRQNADNLYVNLPTISNLATLIQTGTPAESGTSYPLGVQQDVKIIDSVLPGTNEYRIVVTLTVSTL